LFWFVKIITYTFERASIQNISAVDLPRSVLSLVYGLDNRGIGVQFPTRAEIALFSITSTPALGGHQASSAIETKDVGLSLGGKAAGV
jgi:hypothetical protein